MKILFIGKFKKLHDEEYIARSFELLGHDVIRVDQNVPPGEIHRKIILMKPDILLFTKWSGQKEVQTAINKSREWGMKTVCWVFDLYWGYGREQIIKVSPFFKADFVFTTDGGHDAEWKKVNINHQCVRQGIYEPECFLIKPKNPSGIVFVGSQNPLYPERTSMVKNLVNDYINVLWFGRNNSDALRGVDLNRIYATKQIVVGDSVYSPYYWSNRVVETLGRGGFLIHRDVPGLKEEYPDLVTYDGTYADLTAKIDYYMAHEDERQEIIKKNFEWVRNRYTMDKKCAELISNL